MDKTISITQKDANAISTAISAIENSSYKFVEGKEILALGSAFAQLIDLRSRVLFSLKRDQATVVKSPLNATPIKKKKGK